MEPVLSYPSLAVLPLHFPSIHTPMADPLTAACPGIWGGGGWVLVPAPLCTSCGVRAGPPDSSTSFSAHPELQGSAHLRQTDAKGCLNGCHSLST